jgi:lipid-A-disaccharide synthase
MAEKKILIVAGEASSDLHAANLIREIKALDPKINFFGLGGEKMRQAGAEIYYDIVELAVVGFFEVIKNLKKFKGIFNLILNKTDLIHPDLAILVDYPGFNLRLAKQLKKRQIPVIYYISPQIWAWGRNRIKTIKRLINRMLVFFKFEEELYKKEEIPVSFVGHPLLDTVRPTLMKGEIVNKFHIRPTRYTVALLPGSRLKEIKVHLPIMLETAHLIHKELSDVQFLILRTSNVKEEIYNKILAPYKLPFHLLTDITYDGLAYCDFAIVASGTATLETAILGIPMAIIYKVSFSTWLYLKAVIKIPYIGMVNIIANEMIVPEFIQYNAKPRKIANYAIRTLTHEEEHNRIKQLLFKVKSRLGEPSATQRAAREILECLNEDKPR